MRKRFAVYCSGGATRIINFYVINSVENFPLDLVVYDGKNTESLCKLEELFGDKLIVLQNSENLTGARLSQHTSDTILEELKRRDIDYLFCFGDRILKEPLLGVFHNKIINFHPSLLPSFPGLNAIDKALKSSVKLLGNTAHFLDAGIDTGPIIMQSVIARDAVKDYEDVLSLKLTMLKRIWQLLENDQIKVVGLTVEIHSAANSTAYYSY